MGDLPGRLDAIGTGHSQVHERDVSWNGIQQGKGLATVTGIANDLYAIDEPEQGHQSVTNDLLIVDDHHPDRVAVHPGTSTVTYQPSASSPAAKVPPASATRSAIPVRP